MQHRIFIAEDNPSNLKIPLLTLEEEGYDIQYTMDGASAWEILVTSENSFSIIILDWMMPGMNGLELLEKICNDSRLSRIPVIIQTARARSDDIQTGLDKGAFRYLTKPFEEEDLLEMVRRAITEFERCTGISQ